MTIPNNKVLTDVTSCGNYGALDRQVQLDFYVGTDQDFELAERLIAEAVLTSRYAYLDKPAVSRNPSRRDSATIPGEEAEQHSLPVAAWWTAQLLSSRRCLNRRGAMASASSAPVASD